MAFKKFTCQKCGVEPYTEYHSGNYNVEINVNGGFRFPIKLCDKCYSELCDKIDKFLNKDKDKND